MPCCMLDFEVVPEAVGDEIRFDALVRYSDFGDQTRDFILEKADRSSQTLDSGNRN